MKQILFFALIIIVITCGYARASEYEGQENYSDNLSSSIFQPAESSITNEAGAGAGVKVDCSAISADMDYNLLFARIEEYLYAIIGSINIIMLNKTVSLGAYAYAYKTCSAKLTTYVAVEHPEKKQKIMACLSEGTSDTEISVGSQGGAWWPPGSVLPVPWVNMTMNTSNNPGVALKVMGCITKELGKETGDSFRRCVDSEYLNAIEYIKSLMKLSLEEDFRMRIKSTQACILDRTQAENDLTVSLKTQLLPDGTQISLNGSGALIKKITASVYTPDKKELAQFYGHIDNNFIGMIRQDNAFTEKEIDILISWFTHFRKSTWKTAEYTCMTVLEKPVKSKTDKIKMNLCAQYIENLYFLMLKKSLQVPHVQGETKIKREIIKAAYNKVNNNIKAELKRYKNLLKQSKKNAKQYEQEQDRYSRSMKETMDTIQEKGRGHK